jgi:hypothetical protein
MSAMKLLSRILFVILGLIVFSASRITAQTGAAQNGSVQFTARITPSGGVDEPVRSFPFYLLRKSYADIQKEAAASMPGADMNTFIDTLDVSSQLKAWMKKNHWVNLSGEEFTKKLKIDDILDVPEFFSAYVERMTTDASVSFPNPKYKPEDKVKDPEKYDRLKKQYYDAIRTFFGLHPKSADGIDMSLEDVNPGHKWDIYRAKDSSELDQHTSELAQGDYLAARADTDLQGEASMRGVPPGNYWLSCLSIPATAGETRVLWDVPVTVRAGQTSYVTLSNINSVHRRRSTP